MTNKNEQSQDLVSFGNGDVILKKEITVQQGLSKEQCKKINLFIKSTKLKVQAQVQSDSVRVSGKKKDDLQTLMKKIKDQDFDFDVQFTNYR